MTAVEQVESLATWRLAVARTQIELIDPSWPSDQFTKLKAMLLLVGDMHERGVRILNYEVSRLRDFACARDRRMRACSSSASFVRYERPYLRRVMKLQRLREHCDYAYYLFLELTRELIAHG